MLSRGEKMKAENTTLTHDVIQQKRTEKQILLPNPFNVHHVIDFTFPVGSFMLEHPEGRKEIKYKSFSLGKIIGNLNRKDLYADR